VSAAEADALVAARDVRDAGAVLEALLIGFLATVVVVVAVEGVNVVAAEVCAETFESAGVAVADVAAWLALVA
jgi:hypothetical protein